MYVLSSLITKSTKKFYRKEKKTYVKEYTKSLLCEANYDSENIDSSNALCPRRFK